MKFIFEYRSKICREISRFIKANKNNEYFTRRPTYIYNSISLNSSSNEKCFRQQLFRKSTHTHKNTIFNNFFVGENLAVEKYGRVRQGSDDNITLRIRFECWIIKATGTHSEYVRVVCNM